MRGIEDKLGELDRAKGGWVICKDGDDIWVLVDLGPPDNHTVQTNKHKNLHKAVDEAIDLFRAHLSKCPCC